MTGEPASEEGIHRLTLREREILDLMGTIGHTKGVAATLGTRFLSPSLIARLR